MAAKAGDAYAAIVLHAAEQLIQQIHAQRSPARAPLRLLCDTALWHGAPPAALSMSAYADDARTALGQGFCAACVAARTEAQLGQERGGQVSRRDDARSAYHPGAIPAWARLSEE